MKLGVIMDGVDTHGEKKSFKTKEAMRDYLKARFEHWRGQHCCGSDFTTYDLIGCTMRELGATYDHETGATTWSAEIPPKPEHPQTAEVTRLLVHLVASGFTLVSVDDGGEEHATPDVVTAAGHILGVDVSDLRVRHPQLSSPGRSDRADIEIVLGNGPGELCSNYADRSLRECIEAWADIEEANQ